MKQTSISTPNQTSTQTPLSRREKLNAFSLEQQEQPTYRIYWKHICAILPMYLPDGTNGTAVYYEDGTIEQVAATCSYVVDDLLLYLQSSLAVLKQQSARWIGKTGCRRMPLVHSETLCLIPVKVRKNIAKNDSVSGYVVFSKVHAWYSMQEVKDVDLQNVFAVSAEDDCSAAMVIEFVGGTRLQVLDRKRTIANNMSLGIDLMKCYLQEHDIEYQMRNVQNKRQKPGEFSGVS